MIRSLVFDDCFSDGIFKSLDEFREMGLNMPLSLWMRLQSALLYSKKKNRYDTELDSDGKYLADFLNKIRRGSKKFRQIIDKSRYLGDCPSKLSIVATFAKLTNTPLLHRIVLGMYYPLGIIHT
jgi:hypothetical protein